MRSLRALLPINFGLSLGDWTIFDVDILNPPRPPSRYVDNSRGFGFELADEGVVEDVALDVEPFEEDDQ